MTTITHYMHSVSGSCGTLFRRLRTHMVHMAAASEDGTVRATVAYIALLIMACLAFFTQVTNPSGPV